MPDSCQKEPVLFEATKTKKIKPKSLIQVKDNFQPNLPIPADSRSRLLAMIAEQNTMIRTIPALASPLSLY